MLKSRRSMIKVITGTAGMFAAAPWLGAALQRTPQPIPSPNAPSNENAPAGLNPEIVTPDKAQPNPLNQ